MKIIYNLCKYTENYYYDRTIKLHIVKSKS